MSWCSGYGRAMAKTDPDCLFCKIAAGDIPGDIVARTDRAVAFRDIAPVAPTHILLIPMDHEPNAAATAAADPKLAGELMIFAGEIARAEGLDDYRLVANTGAGAQQTVFHTHWHLLGGRGFTWPPG